MTVFWWTYIKMNNDGHVFLLAEVVASQGHTFSILEGLEYDVFHAMKQVKVKRLGFFQLPLPSIERKRRPGRSFKRTASEYGINGGTASNSGIFTYEQRPHLPSTINHKEYRHGSVSPF